MKLLKKPYEVALVEQALDLYQEHMYQLVYFHWEFVFAEYTWAVGTAVGIDIDYCKTHLDFGSCRED